MPLTHCYRELEPDDAKSVAARIYSGPIELAPDGSVHRVDERNAR